MVMSFMTKCSINRSIKNWNLFNAMLLQLRQVQSGASTGELYQELGLKSLQNGCKLRRLRLFYKLYKDHIPPCLHNLIPTGSYSL